MAPYISYYRLYSGLVLLAILPSPMFRSKKLTYPVTPTSSVTPDKEKDASNPQASVDKKWTILLLIALALPVFLETLDYTGRFSPVLRFFCH